MHGDMRPHIYVSGRGIQTVRCVCYKRLFGEPIVFPLQRSHPEGRARQSMEDACRLRSQAVVRYHNVMSNNVRVCLGDEGWKRCESLHRAWLALWGCLAARVPAAVRNTAWSSLACSRTIARILRRASCNMTPKIVAERCW
jgi:hypothetical protein